MIDRSKISSPESLPDSHNVISLPEAEDGLKPSNLPDGVQVDPSGQLHVPVSHLVLPGKGKGKVTSVTCGPFSGVSLASANLQFVLESRLQALLDGHGSPLYSLKWKRWDMPGRVPICALRASARPISVSAYTGWVSPTATDAKRGVKPPRPHDTGIPLTQQVGMISGWATPKAGNGNQVANPSRASKPNGRIEDQAQGAGWATLTTPRKNDSDASAFRWNPNKKQNDPVMQLLGRKLSLSECADGKARPIKPGVYPLVDGFPGRMELLREYGNAIVPQIAARFIEAVK